MADIRASAKRQHRQDTNCSQDWREVRRLGARHGAAGVVGSGGKQRRGYDQRRHARLGPVSDHYFVSYSRADGDDFVSRLADQLTAGSPVYSTWVDVREIQPGKDELGWALKYKKPIVLLRLHPTNWATS
jgi:hypothetical protein